MTKSIYKLSNNLPRNEEYGFRSQITRAATSIGANISEGYARQTKADQKHFMIMARGSLSEVTYLLDMGVELSWWSISEISEIMQSLLLLEVKLHNYISALS